VRGRLDRSRLEQTAQHDADDTTQTMPASSSLPPRYDPESPSFAVHGVAQPRTAIVLLNWNGAQDSIECMQSLLRMKEQDFLIVLCDNHSTDGSFQRLLSWAETALPSLFATWNCSQPPPTLKKLILIQNGANLGFAGGCNVGLRYVLLHTSAEFVWLLNNDTIADADALGLQIAAMRCRPDVGILGSTLIYFAQPDRVQAPGGSDFNFWTARVLPLAKALSPSTLPPENEVEKRLKYISGASMFVRRTFVETVGLLNEQYFLYFEEVDWAVRGRDRFRLGYCAPSTIWHKEGRSIGSNSILSQRSLFSEAYLARNRVLFLKTYFPVRLPVCLIWIAFVGTRRALGGQWKLALTLWKGAPRGLAAPVLPLPSATEWPESMRRPHG
jgi:GT2 family glycosyltransferase